MARSVPAVGDCCCFFFFVRGLRRPGLRCERSTASCSRGGSTPSWVDQRDAIGKGYPTRDEASALRNASRMQPDATGHCTRVDRVCGTPAPLRLGSAAAGCEQPSAKLSFCCIPLSPLVGVSIETMRECQQNDSLADGHLRSMRSAPGPTAAAGLRRAGLRSSRPAAAPAGPPLAHITASTNRCQR